MPSFQATEFSYKMKELSIYLFIFFKRSGSLGTCYSAHPILCGFFKDTPQLLHTLHFQLLAGGILVSVFLLVCNSLLIRNCWNTACCSPPLNCSSAQLCALPDRGSNLKQPFRRTRPPSRAPGASELHQLCPELLRACSCYTGSSSLLSPSKEGSQECISFLKIMFLCCGWLLRDPGN